MAEIELLHFFEYVVAVLDKLRIPYMVVGGFASVVYGRPRFTADVDIVVDMKYHHVEPFVAAFPIPEYYVSREAISEALDEGGSFNVIHPSTGAKVDLVPLPRDVGTRMAFMRRQRVVYDEVTGHAAYFATAEDIVIFKLQAYRGTGSEKHLGDARGILATRWGQLDMAVIRRWVAGMGIEDEWGELLEAVRRDVKMMEEKE